MKFTYRGEEHDLLEIVGENNLSAADRGNGMIISKDGMTLLLQHFPDIDCTFGELEHFKLEGAETLAVQACAFNRQHNELPIGRSYGELSARNADEFALQFPVCTVENRGRNRAVLKHLGITNCFSEEEIKELPKRPKPTTTQSVEHKDEEAEKRELINQVKQITTNAGWDDAKRVRLYCMALGISKDTPANKVAPQLTPVALMKALEIAEDAIKKG